MISSIINRVSYNGNGTSAVYAFQYEFHSQSDLDVYLWNSSRALVAVAQSLNVDYTISGIADAQNRYTNGANVIFNSTPAIGDVIVIVRDPATTNPFGLKFNQVIPNAELTKALDRLTLIEQRINDLATRSVHLHDAFPLTFDTKMPALMPAGAPLVIGSSGQTIEFGVVALSGSTAATYFGILPTNNGGTGLNFSALQGVVYSPGGAAFEQIVNGAVGLVLTSTGPTTAPTFQAFAAALIGSGIIKVDFGGTGTGTSYTQFGLIFASSATQMSSTAAGGTDQPLMGNTGAAPSYKPLNLASNSSVTGVLPILKGGTGQATANAGFNALSPMTTANDLIFMGTSLVAARVAIGASGTVFTSQGATLPPTWSSPSQAKVVTSFGDLSVETLLNTTDVVRINSATGTLELFTTAGNQGKEMDFLHEGATVVQYTLQAATSQLIVNQGVSARTLTLNTNGEKYRTVIDGSSWVVVEHNTDTPWTAWTSTGMNIGSTLANAAMYYKRQGDSCIFRGGFTLNTTIAGQPPAFSLPAGMLIDSTKIFGPQRDCFGTWHMAASTNLNLPDNTRGPFPITYSSTAGLGWLALADDSDSDAASLANTLFSFNNASTLMSSSNTCTFLTGPIPIQGFNS